MLPRPSPGNDRGCNQMHGAALGMFGAGRGALCAPSVSVHGHDLVALIVHHNVVVQARAHRDCRS